MDVDVNHQVNTQDALQDMAKEVVLPGVGGCGSIPGSAGEKPRLVSVV